jgi:flagellar biosynthetic protein FliQ
VQEITLTFVPKIIAILLVTSFTAPFVGAVIFAFAEQTYSRIPNGF